MYVNQSKHRAMKKLTVTSAMFTDMLSGLIASGVTFEAKQISGTDDILIIFTGGF
jgi:hypothetical protein